MNLAVEIIGFGMMVQGQIIINMAQILIFSSGSVSSVSTHIVMSAMGNPLLAHMLMLRMRHHWMIRLRRHESLKCLAVESIPTSLFSVSFFAGECMMLKMEI